MLTIGFWFCIIVSVGTFKDGNIVGGFFWLSLAALCWAKWLTNEIERKRKGDQ